MTNTVYRIKDSSDQLLKNHFTMNTEIVFVILLCESVSIFVSLIMTYLWNNMGLSNFPICQSTYLVVCSSGGVPATSVLGSEVVLSTVTPADPGDPAGDVAAVWGKNRLILRKTQSLLFWP